MKALILPFPLRPRPGAPEVDVRATDDGGVIATVRCWKRLPFTLDAVGLARMGAGVRDLDWLRCTIAERADGLGHVYEVTIPPSLPPSTRTAGARAARSFVPRVVRRFPTLRQPTAPGQEVSQ